MKPKERLVGEEAWKGLGDITWRQRKREGSYLEENSKLGGRGT